MTAALQTLVKVSQTHRLDLADISKLSKTVGIEGGNKKKKGKICVAV